MLPKSKNRFTIKIVAGYLLLGMIVLLAGFFIYSEFNNYSNTQSKETRNIKLLKTNALLTELYEAENLSKLALQNRKRKNLNAYAKKVDSILNTIDDLKLLVKDASQVHKLDTVQILLQQKVYNNAELRKLKVKNENSAPIDSILEVFKKMEADLGRITPETFVPNFQQLPIKTQNSIREYVSILNKNIPKNGSEKTKARELDSILTLSKSMLVDAKLENEKLDRSMVAKELQIYKSDFQLSQKLRSIITVFEQELINGIHSENLNKQTLLKRSAQFAWVAAILGLILVGFFTFLIVNDYWKGQLYREQLEKEKKFSESLLKSREQLISMVSHDIRSPLNTINGYLELMQQKISKKQQADYFENMKSAAGYIENLVNDLLDYSKLKTGKIHVEHTSFILSDLITQTASSFSKTDSDTSIDLQLEITANLKNPIVSDHFRVRQILTNLIGNAFKFTKEGSIKIKAFTTKKNNVPHAVVQVIDSGIGIEKKKLELIFDEFTQVTSSKNEKMGYGLGLTISKKLAELLEGSLSVESELASGSTFTFSFPIKFSSLQEVTEKEMKLHFKDELSLLILDDDESLLKLLREVCKVHGIFAKTFSNFDALKKAAPRDYNLILTDIQMPKTSGFEVVKLFKSGAVPNYNSQPIIAMTGLRELSKNTYLKAGFADVLWKPFSANSLLTILKTMTKSFNPRRTNPNRHPATTTVLYNTKSLAGFLSSDKAIHEVLSAFLKNTDENLSLLSIAINNRQYQQIRAISHKMLPMFRQLHIKSAIYLLEKFELLDPGDSNEKILEDLSLLENVLINLKKEMQGNLAIPSIHNN